MVRACTWALAALGAGQAMYSGCFEKAELRPAWLGLKGRRLFWVDLLALEGPSASYFSMHKWHHKLVQSVWCLHELCCGAQHILPAQNVRQLLLASECQ